MCTNRTKIVLIIGRTLEDSVLKDLSSALEALGLQGVMISVGPDDDILGGFVGGDIVDVTLRKLDRAGPA